VELCEEKLPTYFINSEENILSEKNILHYNFHSKEIINTENYLPQTSPMKILITSGASCPDALVEGVINKIASFYPVNITSEEMIKQFHC
jgi:4-hydroxy-3-methylbut-2-enyl diphosphate reductase